MEEKDLTKLTATKLREIASQYEGISGAHALKKEDLIREIRRARGEPDEPIRKKQKLAVKKDVTLTIGSLKKEIKVLKEEKKAAHESQDQKTAVLLQKRIKKYRRLTRIKARTKA